MHRQHGSVPREGFHCWTMDDHVDVAVGMHYADVSMGILAAYHLHVGGIDPSCEDGGDHVIQRRLPTFLPP